MYPKHPNQIIIKNKFYPNGLTELDLWNHYQKYKTSILEQVKNRDIMIFIKIDDSILIKRKGKTTNFIRLNNNNYDDIITGRVISIHSAMKRYENIAVIDIDTDNFDKAKEAVIDCYNVLNKFPIITDKRIRFTGKTSFHIFCTLSKKINIDSIRFLLKKIFINSIISQKYSIEKSRSSNVNIDLFRNTFRGNHIVLNSLSIIGLKCTEIPLNYINNFKREYSII